MMTSKESSLKKTWEILLPFLIYFVVHDLAQVLLAFLMNLSLGVFGESYAQYIVANAQTVNGILNALSLFIGMASVWPMAHKEFMWARARREEKQSANASTVQEYLLLAIFAVTLALGANILLTLTGITGSSEAYNDVAVRQYGVSFGVGIIIYGILSPVAEEIVFRGLIFNRMKRYFPVGLSVVVCGILFGFYHGNLVQAIYGCILGIAITFTYELYEDFAVPVLFHSLANLSVFIVGYKQQWFSSIATTLNCGVFLAIAVLSLVLIVKKKKN